MYIRLRYPGAVACFKIENEMYHTVASIPSGGQATVNPGEKLLVRWADHLQLTGLLRLHGCGGPGKLLGTVMMVRGHSPPLKGPSGHRGWGGGPNPALLPPELVLFTAALCCLVSKMLLLNKIRFPNSFRTT